MGLPRLSASQSFTAEEIALLDQMLRAARRGGDASVMARHPAFGSLCRKVQVMNKRTRAAAEERREMGAE